MQTIAEHRRPFDLFSSEEEGVNSEDPTEYFEKPSPSRTARCPAKPPSDRSVRKRGRRLRRRSIQRKQRRRSSSSRRASSRKTKSLRSKRKRPRYSSSSSETEGGDADSESIATSSDYEESESTEAELVSDSHDEEGDGEGPELHPAPFEQDDLSLARFLQERENSRLLRRNYDLRSRPKSQADDDNRGSTSRGTSKKYNLRQNPKRLSRTPDPAAIDAAVSWSDIRLPGDEILGVEDARTPSHPGDERAKRPSPRSGIEEEPTQPPLTFESIAGMEECVERLQEMVVLPLLRPDLLQSMGIRPPRGILFHGPPGTGKTLMARILADRCSRLLQQTAATAAAEGGHPSPTQQHQRVSFFLRNGSDCLSKWIGEAERNLRNLFHEARAKEPAIIFFDELDGLAPDRSARNADQGHVSLVATLLALMDGLDDRGRVVVIGATNRVDSLDSALRRPGRFDREFYFGLPSEAARRQILGIHTRSWPSATPAPAEASTLHVAAAAASPAAAATSSAASSSVSAANVNVPFAQENEQLIASVARQTEGWSGADLAGLCTEAALNALRRSIPALLSPPPVQDAGPPDDQESQVTPLGGSKSLPLVQAQDFDKALGQMAPSRERRFLDRTFDLPFDLDMLFVDWKRSLQASVAPSIHRLSLHSADQVQVHVWPAVALAIAVPAVLSRPDAESLARGALVRGGPLAGFEVLRSLPPALSDVSLIDRPTLFILGPENLPSLDAADCEAGDCVAWKEIIRKHWISHLRLGQPVVLVALLPEDAILEGDADVLRVQSEFSRDQVQEWAEESGCAISDERPSWTLSDLLSLALHSKHHRQ